MKELTLDILDEAIKAVEEVRHKSIVRIHLNPDDWREASDKMEILTGVSTNTAFGIPVITDPSLKRNMFILVYNTYSGEQLVGWEVKQ